MAKDLYVPVSIRGGRFEAKAQLGQTVIVTEGPETYTGPVTVTPTTAEQTLLTKDKLLTDNVTVERIPSEYIIPTGTETINVTENGTVSKDVTSKETVTVNVDVPVPTGTKQISINENGTTTEDVAGYANTEISVDVPTERDYDTLPTEYQCVEYIESTGTQWIDTGYHAGTKKTAVHMGVTPKSTTITQGICGARNNDVAADLTSCSIFLIKNAGFRFDWSLGNTLVTASVTLNKFVEIHCARLVNDENVTTAGTFLVGNFSNGSVPFSTGFIGRIHFAKLYDSGKPVRYLIPCYRKSDGVIGMYDTVNGVFYTNAGTGTFGKGADI